MSIVSSYTSEEAEIALKRQNRIATASSFFVSMAMTSLPRSSSSDRRQAFSAEKKY